MGSPDNRRRHPRFDVDHVYGRLRSDPRAMVLNLSADGLAIETGAWLEVGKPYEVRVQSGDDSMEINGTVVWCRLVGFRDGNPRYQAGLHFGNALSRSGRRVVHFAEEAGAAGGSRRVFGRWELPDESTADLRADARFRVRRLSQAGMLIHTDSPPAVDSRIAFDLDLGDGELHGSAVVRNVVESEAGPAGGWLVGAQFVDLSRADQLRLKTFLERFAEPPAAGAREAKR
jgi:hypothetical protein